MAIRRHGLKMGLFLLIAAYVLTWSIYNPFNVSYASWVMDGNIDLYKVLVGLILVACVYGFLRMTYRNLSWTVIFFVAPMAVLAWIVVNEGLVSMTGDAIQWILLIVVPLILAIGTSWGFFYRWLTGTVPTDDLET